MHASTHGSLRFVLFASAVAAIGGFLFGYDTAVINGANTFLQTHFALDAKRDALRIGLATASAILGCIPGAMSAGFISDRFGRRRVLYFCAVLYALAGILSAIPQTFGQFIAARVLSGIAIGVSSMICPVYIAEIAPPQWRGRLGSLFQLGIVTGIFVTLFINGWIQRPDDAAWNAAYGWRWMLAAEAIPAFIFLALLVPIPESPRWLIQAKREGDARRVLDRMGGKSYADSEIAAVQAVLQQEQGGFGELFSRRYRLPLLIALVLMFGSQLSGINAIMYYSTEIFKNATGNANAAFNSSVWIGLVNFIATFIAIGFVDKAGRKPLLLIGNAVQVLALVAVGIIYASNPHSPALLGFVILYIAAFAMAMGPLPWIVCSEIFPAKLRGRAMSVATFCIWTGCLLVAQTFPALLGTIGPRNTFWTYALCSAVTLVLVWWWLPETKGRTLEEIETHFVRQA
ncbi:MAG TPA: sugar porter family MFS transporter [Verrucomicrobiae bacterium]|nr:sugar porter family MFS transporter [Verrucomicrobiae bacterium]